MANFCWSCWGYNVLYSKYLNFQKVRKSRGIFLNFPSCFPSPNVGITSIWHMPYCKHIAAVSNFTNMVLVKKRLPSKQLLSQSQPKKHLKNVWNMFKVDNKNSRSNSSMSLWCHYFWLWTYFVSFSSVSIIGFELVVGC